MKVNEQSPAVAAMVADWDLIDALRGGTGAMRAAGTRYLPKRRLESDEDYKNRLATAVLFPALSETVKKMVGRVFAAPLQVEGAPKWIEDDVLDDVDQQGRNLHVWARDWFDQALGYGLSHVLVDSPPAPADAPVTVEAQRRAGVRPYLVKVSPRDVLGWKSVAGKLTQVRIMSSRVEDDGEFGERIVPQVRVYEVGKCRVFEQPDKNKDWIEKDTILMGLDRIPLITLYTQRTGMLTATPPLRELAQLNAKHWRIQSSNDTLLDTASVPVLVVTGVEEGDDIIIGAKNAVRLPIGGKLEFCEHSGKAIGSGRTALEDLKDEMRQAGAKLLEPRAKGEAVTEHQADEEAAGENSDLGAMALQLQDTLIGLLDLIAEWRGETDGGEVKLQPNLEPEQSPVDQINTQLSLHRDGIVSRRTVYEQAQALGFVPEALDWEQEQVRIQEEGGAPGGDPDPQ